MLENEKLPLPTISASKVKVFKTCSREYWYKYLQSEKLPEKKNVAALLGTALHKAIEMKFIDNSEPSFTFQTTMLETLDDWQKYGDLLVGEQYWTGYLKEGKRILRDMDWAKYNPMIIDNKPALEYVFTLPFPNAEEPICYVTGIIDMISQDAFDYIIIDHKSSKKPLAQDELDNDPQFILYYWAGLQLFKYAPSHIYWNHLRTGEFIEANIANNYEDKLAQLTEDIKAMFSTTNYQRKNMDSFCRNLCSFYTRCFPVDNSPVSEEIDTED